MQEVHSSYLNRTPGRMHCARPSLFRPTAKVCRVSVMPVGPWTHRSAACGCLVFWCVGAVSAMYQVANFRCVKEAGPHKHQCVVVGQQKGLAVIGKHDLKLPLRHMWI